MFLFSDASKTSQRLGNLSQAVYTSAQRVDVTSLDEGCRYGSMRETIVKIRELLGELEQDAESSADATERALVSGLELPDIIRDVVDLLFPQLKPYEAFLYMYIFRHSVVETGAQLMRVSRRRLTSGVVKSQFEGTRSGGGAIVSTTTYKTVQSGLDSLETIGAIRREAEPTREGTLYRVPPAGEDRGVPPGQGGSRCRATLASRRRATRGRLLQRPRKSTEGLRTGQLSLPVLPEAAHPFHGYARPCPTCCRGRRQLIWQSRDSLP